MTDERRPIDRVHEAVGITQDAAELAEHIKENKPNAKRDELFDLLVCMIDDAHEEALNAAVEMENE